MRGLAGHPVSRWNGLPGRGQVPAVADQTVGEFSPSRRHLFQHGKRHKDGGFRNAKINPLSAVALQQRQQRSIIRWAEPLVEPGPELGNQRFDLVKCLAALDLKIAPTAAFGCLRILIERIALGKSVSHPRFLGRSPSPEDQ